MKRRAWLAAASALALAACGKQDGGSVPSPAAGNVPVSVEKIAAEAKGFDVGSPMSTRVVYVFFDTQCPHCATLWEAARGLKPQARFVWIPVGLLGEKSVAQGASILGAADPVAAMDENEASVREQKGGIAAMGVADAQKEAVKRNTALHASFGFGGVPTVIGRHAGSGELVVIDGALPTAALAQRLGLNPPV